MDGFLSRLETNFFSFTNDSTTNEAKQWTLDEQLWFSVLLLLLLLLPPFNEMRYKILIHLQCICSWDNVARLDGWMDGWLYSECVSPILWVWPSWQVIDWQIVLCVYETMKTNWAEKEEDEQWRDLFECSEKETNEMENIKPRP